MSDIIDVPPEQRELLALQALRLALGNLSCARVRFLLTDGKGAAQGYRIYDVDLSATGLADPGRINVFLAPAPAEERRVS